LTPALHPRILRRHLIPRPEADFSRVSKRIPTSTVRRLSLYLRHLEEEDEAGRETLSSKELAQAAGTTPAQVRKDLSVFGSFGVRGLGYAVRDLHSALQKILGLDRKWSVALVGAGKVGGALFSYQTFRNRGFRIRAVFDIDPDKVGDDWNGVVVRDVADIPAVVREQGIEMAILAVPPDSAQEVANELMAAGVGAILNFAPVKLEALERVLLRNVDMTMELEGLAFGLRRGSVAGAASRRLSSS